MTEPTGIPSGERARTAATEPPADTPARDILIVDDNIDSAESLAMLLRLFGHETRVAHDGPAALRAAKEKPPQVVLLDIGMPGMDGYEVARRLRADYARSALLLIGLSGYDDEEIARKAQLAGFDHRLVKPLDIDALRALLS